MLSYFEFALLAATSLFTMMSPISVVPIFLSMVDGKTSEYGKKIAFKSTLTALITLFIFALSGEIIFKFFSISVNSLRVVGGILFFHTGFDMLQSNANKSKGHHESIPDDVDDGAVTPLGIPMLCGPGSITVTILLMQDAKTIGLKITLLSVIFFITLISFIILVASRKIVKFLGESGTKVMLKIMGLILMVIAVEFFFAGIKPIFRDIFNIL
ncbi:NAAT family transporter [bacterium]|nr:NAAT family transporter [bacterium]